VFVFVNFNIHCPKQLVRNTVRKMNISYFLDKKLNRKGEAQIFLFLRENNEQIKISTGLKVEPKYWDIRRQLPKGGLIGSPEFNSYLAKLKAYALGKYLESLGNHQGDRYWLKQEINEYLGKGRSNKKEQRLIKVIPAWIESQKVALAKRTLQKFKTLLLDLQYYEKQNKCELFFENIDLDFYDKYYTHLLRNKFSIHGGTLLNDTIAKYIQTLKSFLRWGEERGYHSNRIYAKFKTPKSQRHEIVTLTSEELETIYNLNLSSNPRLEKARDLFCFACFTGQRWSDVAQFSKEQVIDNSWQFKSVKTKKLTVVPFLGYCTRAMDILKKYNFELPNLSNQKLNDYIKEIGKLAGINQKVSITRYSGQEKLTITKPKYEFMASHMARRTATTLLLQSGMNITTLQRLTNHENIETLMKYNNTTVKQLEKELGELNQQSQTRHIAL